MYLSTKNSLCLQKITFLLVRVEQPPSLINRKVIDFVTLYISRKGHMTLLRL